MGEEVASGPAIPTTLVLALAAVGAALVAMVGSDDSFTSTTVAGSLVGLVPWALVAGGVSVPPGIFAAWSLACASLVVIVDRNPGGMFPLMILVVWVMRTSDDRRVTFGALGAAATLIVALAAIDGTAHETGMVYFLGGLAISALSGRMLRRQERITAELEAMHDLRVTHAATAERARIARDVHDVVAHSLTVVMLHLTGARRALATDPRRADEALARAERVGRDSLDSIRQVMGLLREPGTGTDVPVPGIGDLPALIDGYRTGGLAVTAEVAPAAGLDPTAGLVVYRVVQESLTNVLRHAAGAACMVTVRSTPAAIEVVVDNGRGHAAARPGAGAGLGVRGMIERVRALGGELVAGPRPDGGWRVVAAIPRRGGAPPPAPLEQEAGAAGPATVAPEGMVHQWPQPHAT